MISTQVIWKGERDQALAFLLPIGVYDVACLLYALNLCFINRSFPSDLNESKWITASIVSIFQALMLGVPVLIISWVDTNVFFFLRAAIVLTVSAAVLCFVFVPKFYGVHFPGPLEGNVSNAAYWSVW